MGTGFIGTEKTAIGFVIENAVRTGFLEVTGCKRLSLFVAGLCEKVFAATTIMQKNKNLPFVFNFRNVCL